MKKISLFIFLFFLVSLTCFVGISVTKSSIKNTKEVKDKQYLVHPQLFFNEKLFQLGVEQVKQNPIFNSPIFGGVVPHDTFAGFMIADVFKIIKTQDFKTLVILGPNHREKGEFKFLTSNSGWLTEFGIVEADEELVNKFLKTGMVGLNFEFLTNEHSVSSLMPYVKYYLPDIQVVPLIVGETTTEKDLDIFLNNIKIDDLNSLIFIASVDFSHYLNKDLAEVRDAETLKTIQEFNYKKLFSFNNDYLDSPGSLVFVMKLMEKLGRKNIKVLHHNNLQDLTSQVVCQTSSYFALVFF